MNDERLYIQKLFTGWGLPMDPKRAKLFDAFIADEVNINAVTQILENQKMLTNKWKLKNRIADIIQQSVMIPNGTVGKPYQAQLDFLKLGWNDIVFSELEGLEQVGLKYDNESEIIQGTPEKSGDYKIRLKFRVDGEAEDSALNEKIIPLVINPDPKSLWKNEPSNRNDPYWKEDDVAAFGKLGDKHVVVASKRGRSHANVGSFRDDDYAFKHFEQTGWNVVVVADGAGSAKYSRKGSLIACNEIVNYFETNWTSEALKEFDEALLLHKNNGLDDAGKKEVDKRLSHFIYNSLSKAAFSAHQKLVDFAKETETNLKDTYTTLIFALFKKYEFGYAVLSFGVGDCPIALLNKDLSEVMLMNWLDVGEFGGGTRFINMQEIFSSDKFPTRFRFRLVDDFSYLMLMTDGIYDPKFVVEANLEKIEKWKAFVDDLQGNNDDKTKVEFSTTNTDIANQLSKWMDFWSPGNHDDRTLAIVF
jgi:serine/threonine protein phosphatase PrpC